MRRWLVGGGVALTFVLLGCGGAGKNTAGAEGAETKGASNQAQCSNLVPPTEPELFAWDAGARASLKHQLTEGVVVVRYEPAACGVALEVLSRCTVPLKYSYAPASIDEQSLATTSEELRAWLPLGGARLADKLQGGSALRADAAQTGRLFLPPDTRVTRSALKGDDCSRATHVVFEASLGGFALTLGDARSLEDAPSPLSAQAPAIAPLALEGDAKSCAQARQEGAENPRCSAPLRVRLVPLSASAPSAHSEMVKIPRDLHNAGFWLDRTEVTVSAYAACVKSGECKAPSSENPDKFCTWGKAGKEQHPITCVNWAEADAYCKAQGKRLPSEEEWQRAASGGDGRVFPWGNDYPADEQLCWSKEDGTCAAGVFPSGASRHGVQDLAGNVWEWTASHGSDAQTFVIRGGAWHYSVGSYVKATSRTSYLPSYQDNDLGFRCAQ